MWKALLELVISAAVKMAAMPAIRWVRAYVAKKKYNKKVDEVIIDESTKTSVELDHNHLP
jgi:hypothetical protein